MKNYSIFSRLFFCVPVIAFMTMSSCIDGFVSDFKNMTHLSDSLQQVFPGEKIGVKISNGTHIRVSFINSELSDLDNPEKDQTALEVGKVARHFYPSARVQHGKLSFLTHKDYGVMDYKEEVSTHALWP